MHLHLPASVDNKNQNIYLILKILILFYIIHANDEGPCKTIYIEGFIFFGLTLIRMAGGI